MARPRSEVFIREEVGVYHCCSRITRGRHLFGLDAFSGKNYDRRKDHVRRELRRLAKEMAIQILDYAVLCNHLHTQLRNRPDIVAKWSNWEVVRRWWRTCPRRRKPNGQPAKATRRELEVLMEKVDELRVRLSDISWIMRLATQRVAIRANKEDRVTGRFFGQRFHCERMESEADVLACSMYIDLNWVHAGMAKTPETSKYTSAFERIRGKWTEHAKGIGNASLDEGDNFDGDWLAPVYYDPRSEALVTANDLPAEAAIEFDEHSITTEPLFLDESKENDGRITFYNPVGSNRVSDVGFLGIKLEQYITLLDKVGRKVRKDKRGYIPKALPPIMERIGGDAKSWFDKLWNRFQMEPNFRNVRPA